MGKKDVEQALRAMENEEIRLEVSQGDFSQVSHLVFTRKERVLVRDAAGDYPDVARRAFRQFEGASDKGAGGKDGTEKGGGPGSKGKLELLGNKNKERRGFKYQQAVDYTHPKGDDRKR